MTQPHPLTLSGTLVPNKPVKWPSPHQHTLSGIIVPKEATGFFTPNTSSNWCTNTPQEVLLFPKHHYRLPLLAPHPFIFFCRGGQILKFHLRFDIFKYDVQPARSMFQSLGPWDPVQDKKICTRMHPGHASLTNDGTNGGFTFFVRRSCQLTFWEQKHTIHTVMPPSWAV